MIVDMEGICKDYPSDSGTVHALTDVNLKIEKGDYIAIMGPSGSGKTTLMNIKGFLDLPSSGTYLLNGADETQSNEDHLAEVRNKHIGFVFQTFYLLPGLTAVENVALPLLYADVPSKERLERAREALTQVGLEDRISFYPRQLSGGQCQRVAIARAMVAHPQLLLADEPTGALDSTAGSQIMDIFRRLNDEGMTIVMITHERAVAECANKIYTIFDGRLSEGDTISWESALEDHISSRHALGERPGDDNTVLYTDYGEDTDYTVNSGGFSEDSDDYAEDSDDYAESSDDYGEDSDYAEDSDDYGEDADYERDEEFESEYAAVLEDEENGSDSLFDDDDESDDYGDEDGEDTDGDITDEEEDALDV